MNWKRVLTRANLMWLEIGLAVLLGLVVASQVLALPEESGTSERQALMSATEAMLVAAPPQDEAHPRSRTHS